MHGICPKCHKNNILINLYGYPDIAYVEMMKEKGVFFNIKGCAPPPAQNAFAYQCKDCEFEFEDLNILETYELEFSIGSWRDRQHITYNQCYLKHNNTPFLIPSEEDWKLFWNTVDDLNVWKWEKDYFDPHILDGEQWELLIKRKGLFFLEIGYKQKDKTIKMLQRKDFYIKKVLKDYGNNYRCIISAKI